MGAGAKVVGDDPAPTKPFPKYVFLIIGNEMCERFSFYGLRAILAVYFTDFLGFTEGESTELVHGFIFVSYACCLLGGYISDAWWGRFRTILLLSLVYVLGGATLSFTAIPKLMGTPPAPWGAFGALLLLALGSGGIKPCVSSFVGDQFTVGQERYLKSVFFIFYFSINLGSVMSTILTPVIQKNFSFAAAFSVPAVLLVVALCFFVSGGSYYIRAPPAGSAMYKAILGEAWSQLKQGMVRKCPCLCCCCRPSNKNKSKPYYYLANSSADASPLSPKGPHTPGQEGNGSGEEESGAVVHRGTNGNGNGNANGNGNGRLTNMGASEGVSYRKSSRESGRRTNGNGEYLPVSQSQEDWDRGVSVDASDPRAEELNGHHHQAIAKEQLQVKQDLKSLVSVAKVFAAIPVFWALFDQHSSRWIFQARKMNLLNGKVTASQVPAINPFLAMILIPTFNRVVYPGLLRIGIDVKPLHRLGIGMLLAAASFAATALLEMYIQSQPHLSVSVLWQLPQYFLIGCSEVMVSITGLEFAYSQAPSSLKGMIMAMWLVTVALGNILVVLIATISLSSTVEFWFFGGLMLAFALLFIIFTRNYKYRSEAEAVVVVDTHNGVDPTDKLAIGTDGEGKEWAEGQRRKTEEGDDLLVSAGNSDDDSNQLKHVPVDQRVN